MCQLRQLILAGSGNGGLFLRLSKKPPVFSDKRFTVCCAHNFELLAQNSTTSRLSGIFSHAHVARENDLNALPPADGKLCEAFSTGHFLLYYTVKVSLFLNIL